MIISEKGQITAYGTASEILADFGCITASVIDSLAKTGINREVVEMVVDDIVDTAKKSSAAKHDKEKAIKSVKGFLKKILEEMED